MRSNYKSWDVKLFFKKNLDIRFLLKYAILAPSSHNSQPWRFVVKENRILIFADYDKRLAQSDPDNRQLYISIGCAIENLLEAANFYGYNFVVEYFSGRESELVADIKFNANIEEKKEKNLAEFIPIRSTNRNKYFLKSLPQELLADIFRLHDDEIKIQIVSESSLKNRISDLILESTASALENDYFRIELSKYIKHNLTRDYYGMPGFTIGLPLILSFLAPILIKNKNIAKATRKKDEKLLKKFTPYFIIISSKIDDKMAWVKSGIVYEKIALLSAKHQVSTSIWAAPIQILNYFEQLKLILNDVFRPQVLFRIGYPLKNVKHSPRNNNII